MNRILQSTATRKLSALVGAVAALSASPTWGAARYADGQTGLFGNPESDWNYGGTNTGGGQRFDTVNKALDYRFTAMENVTVDAVYQRFVQPSATPATYLVGIMADNGSGLPTGTYLASASITPSGTGGVLPVTFGSSLNLNANSIYHIVTRVTAGNSTGAFVYGDRNVQNLDIRPYDRASDSMMTVLRSTDGGGNWTASDYEGYFMLANGSNYIAGPSLPISSVVTTKATTGGGTSGNASRAFGQRFVITDKEVPTGASVNVSSIQMKAASATTTSNLIIELRTDDMQVLASTIMAPSQADTTWQTLNLNQQVTLTQGTAYLLTTRLEGDPSTTSGSYAFYAHATAAAAQAAMGWGGTDYSLVYSGVGNDWSTHTQDTSFDAVFSFEGVVAVPEPATAALLVVPGCMLLASRRRRGNRL